MIILAIVNWRRKKKTVIKIAEKKPRRLWPKIKEKVKKEARKSKRKKRKKRKKLPGEVLVTRKKRDAQKVVARKKAGRKFFRLIAALIMGGNDAIMFRLTDR